MEDRGRGALDIAASTRKLDANDRLPLKIYYRTANTLLHQASIYREEGNILDLYILLVRFCSLVTETIPEHRDYKNVPAKEKLFFKKKLAEAIPELEALKPRVQKEVERINHQHEHHVTSQFPSEWPPSTSESPENYQVVSSASSGYGYRGVESGKLSTASFSLSTLRPRDETVSRHSYFGLPQQNKKEVHRNAAVKVQYPSYIDDSPVDIPSMAQNFSTATTFSTAEPLAMQPTGQENSIWARPGSRLQQEIVASRFDPYDLVAQLAPPLAATPVPPAVAAPVQAAPLTFENGQLWPSEVADPRPGSPQLHADLSGQKSPKNLHISAKMMDEFMAVARSNTMKNLETCGILAGFLRKGVFNVTTLIIPKQESTSDSCQTVNEEEIFEIQDKRNLFQLGWIHTHPSQTCFMSSIDLHTHYSYQVMLNEAIAIVMAPTDAERNFGIFRLSDPGGMKVIQQCQQRGFHPHEEPIEGGAIYVHSSHVFMNPGLKFEVLDLR